jgi:hypothetical protein
MTLDTKTLFAHPLRITEQAVINLKRDGTWERFDTAYQAMEAAKADVVRSAVPAVITIEEVK